MASYIIVQIAADGMLARAANYKPTPLATPLVIDGG